MKLFVINLERDQARRESMQRQLDGLKLPFEFVPAVLGSALSPAELAECYDDKKARRLLCKPLTRSEIGCALSHLKIYRKMIEQNIKVAFILEDDVVLTETVPSVIAELEKTINVERPEIILLSPAEGKSDGGAKKLRETGHELLNYKDGFYASAYLITNLAARTLSKELYPIGDVADCWGRLKSYKVVDLFVVNPALIEQDRAQFGSSTSDDIWKLLNTWSLADKLIFKCRRAWSISLDFIYAIYRRKFVPYAGIDLNLRTDHEKQK